MLKLRFDWYITGDFYSADECCYTCKLKFCLRLFTKKKIFNIDRDGSIGVFCHLLLKYDSYPRNKYNFFYR